MEYLFLFIPAHKNIGINIPKQKIQYFRIMLDKPLSSIIHQERIDLGFLSTGILEGSNNASVIDLSSSSTSSEERKMDGSTLPSAC